MVFPVMALYFYLLWDESGHIMRKRTFYGLLVGLTCALGSLIKFTVAIALIAIVIYHICVKRVEHLPYRKSVYPGWKFPVC